jgi:hypothetical protein
MRAGNPYIQQLSWGPLSIFQDLTPRSGNKIVKIRITVNRINCQMSSLVPVIALISDLLDFRFIIK